jgi:hypothetical protein
LVAFLAGMAVLAVTLPDPFIPGSRRPSARASNAAPNAMEQMRPTATALPKYLTQSYRAPPELVRPGAGGTLRIPSLGIWAPVDAVGLDGTAMAVPNDSARVGWLASTAQSGDLIGPSVLAGHVSDQTDRPGALARLDRVKVGAAIIWTDADGQVHRFRVTGLERFPRSAGLPSRLFTTSGPHLLHLVTCADRQQTAGGGFHYAANLVVTARERTHQTERGASD